MQALYQWQLAGAAVSDIEAQFLANQDFAKADREYFHDLLHGVPAQVKELDELLTPFLDRRVEELSQIEKAILRLGAFELKERLDVPYRVVINEGIELAPDGATCVTRVTANDWIVRLAPDQDPTGISEFANNERVLI